ncbi:MAG TPA: trypsin-like peptidase domain-containing protein [Opitutaceae bacterium]|nr:trypsin-like peptidase domain-containing protein [Opitutaceae bacterium]
MKTLLVAGLIAFAFTTRCIAAEPDELEDLQKRADEGKPSAQYYLGLRHYHGLGVPKDERIAAQWFERAARAGESGAQLNLARMLRTGRGVAPDMQKSVQMYRAAAARGVQAAMVELGEILSSGGSVATDFREALRLFNEAAAAGNAQAEFNLGLMHGQGLGTPPDAEVSRKWYERAAARGDPNAQFNLATLLLSRGENAPLDRIVDLLTSAAAQNLARANHTLGVLNEEGRGVPQNLPRAAACYRAAAENGYAGSQASLGRMLVQGRGVVRDDSEAVQWLTLAVKQNEPSAMFNLAMMGFAGVGVRIESANAAEMLRQAATLGFGPAQSRLALCYLRGEGVKADPAEAAAWTILAREQDASVPGAEELDAIPESAIASAQVRAASLRIEIESRMAAVQRSGNSSLLSAAEINTPRSAASGFFVSGDGLLVTSYTAVAEASDLRVVVGSAGRPAKLVAVDEEADIAILQCDTPSPAWLAPSSQPLVIGETYHLVGYHRALESPGEVAWLTAPVVLGPEPPDRRNLYAVGRFWPPSMAGGAMVDDSGRYAGVLTSRADFQQRMVGSESSPFSTEPGFIANWAAIGAILNYAGLTAEPPPDEGPAPADESALAAKVSRAVVTVLVY